MRVDALPEYLGQYQVVRRLALGGMAEVLLATLSGIDGFRKDVVIKRVLPQHSSAADFIAMFRDEARIMSQLHHGNIVQVIEFGEEHGQQYLVLEYVNGPTLGTTLAALSERAMRFTILEVAHVASEVARALDYAHRKRGADGMSLQIVHRDVTPSNILLSREGEVKLADFGIARARARLAATEGSGITFKGKLAYAAPETLSSGQADARSDMFALGAVMYHMLTGGPAFRGESEAETVGKILLDTLPPPSQANAAVPPELDALVASLLARDPARRPPRALAVADAVAPWLSSTEPPVECLAQTIAELFPNPKIEVPTARPPRPRVLVVHESRTVRGVLEVALGATYSVVEMADPEQALLAVQQAPLPAAVLCQRTVVGRSAFDLWRRIRANSQLGDMLFVVLASDDSPELRAEAAEAGVPTVAPRSLDAEKLGELLGAKGPDSHIKGTTPPSRGSR